MMAVHPSGFYAWCAEPESQRTKIGACLDISSSRGWKAARCTATGKYRTTCATRASNVGSIAFIELCVPPVYAPRRAMASAASNAVALRPWWRRIIYSGNSM
jgi:hypothetical protein